MHFGTCKCKSVRYQFKGQVLTCYACHCTDCQASSNADFKLSMVINRDDIEIIDGELSIHPLDFNNTEAQRHYCSQCNITLWHSAIKFPNMLALEPMSFEDKTWFKPVAHIWVQSAKPETILESNTVKYQQHAKISELIELWTKTHE